MCHLLPEWDTWYLQVEEERKRNIGEYRKGRYIGRNREDLQKIEIEDRN